MSDEEQDRPIDLWQWLDSIKDAAMEFGAHIVLILMIVGILFAMGYVNSL